MSDRRRINGPSGGSSPPVFVASGEDRSLAKERSRAPLQVRKMFLQTGLTPSASGSAYLELEASTPRLSSLKITCTVHGPRPLPRSSSFSSQLVLSTHVKMTPFATKYRRGYVRDATERDLSAHLESALRGVIIGERWPKSGVEVIATVLEAEEEAVGPSNAIGCCGMMNILSGCITAASAALVEAGIDCVDLATGGVAALVRESNAESHASNEQTTVVLDPHPSEHEVLAACIVGHLASRDELVETWLQGYPGPDPAHLIDKAVEAAHASRAVLAHILSESTTTRVAG